MNVQARINNLFNQSIINKTPENGRVTSLSNGKIRINSCDRAKLTPYNNKNDNNKNKDMIYGLTPLTKSNKLFLDKVINPWQKYELATPSKSVRDVGYFTSILSPKLLLKNREYSQKEQSCEVKEFFHEAGEKKECDEKTYFLKNNKIMKSIDNLYKSLKLSREKSNIYRSNMPVYKGNGRTLDFDFKDYQVSSPISIKKSQMVTSYVMRDHSKQPNEMKKLNLDNFDKDKKEDSFILFKMEFDPEYVKKANRKSFFK